MSAADLSKVREVVKCLNGELDKARDTFFELDTEFAKIPATTSDSTLAPRNNERRQYYDYGGGRSRRGGDLRSGKVRRLSIDDLNDYVEAENRRRKRRLLEDENNPEILTRVGSNGTPVVVTFFGNRGDEVDGDKDSSGKARKTRSREEALAEQRNDTKERDRSKRMLGALLGTLHKFREEEQVPVIPISEDDEAEKKAEIEEAARKERRESKMRRQKLISDRNTKLVEIKRLEVKKHRLYEIAVWTECTKPLANFIRTDATPHIFYKPKVPHPVLETLHQKSHLLINNTISDKCKGTMESLDAFDQRVTNKMLKSSCIHSLTFDKSNLVKEELKQELEDLLNHEVAGKAHFNPAKIQNELVRSSDFNDLDMELELGSENVFEEGEIIEDQCEERKVIFSSTTQEIEIKRVFSSSQHKNTDEEETEALNAGNSSNPVAPPVAPDTWNNAIRTKTLPSIYYMPKIPIDFAKLELARNKNFEEQTKELRLDADAGNLGNEETSLQITIFTGNDESTHVESGVAGDDVEEGELLSGVDGNIAEDDIDIGDLQVTVYCNPNPPDKPESLEVINSTCNSPKRLTTPNPAIEERVNASVDIELMEIDDDIDYIIEEYVDDYEEGGKNTLN